MEIFDTYNDIDIKVNFNASDPSYHAHKVKMKYMQIKGGQKLHLVYEPGEGVSSDKLIPIGHFSAPICGRGFDENGNHRITINVPLASACKRCLRVHKSRHMK